MINLRIPDADIDTDLLCDSGYNLSETSNVGNASGQGNYSDVSEMNFSPF
jgi:hypothetical protein